MRFADNFSFVKAQTFRVLLSFFDILRVEKRRGGMRRFKFWGLAENEKQSFSKEKGRKKSGSAKAGGGMEGSRTNVCCGTPGRQRLMPARKRRAAIRVRKGEGRQGGRLSVIVERET